MTAFVVRRLALMLPVLIGVTMLTYLGLELASGDPVTKILGRSPGELSQLTEEDIDQMREAYGLNGPLPVRYARNMWRMIQGDFGRSIQTSQPVTTMIRERIGVSMWLMGTTLILSTALGITLGVIAGINRGSKIDLLATMAAVSGISVPGFWLAILLILVFSVRLQWLPTAGWTSPTEDPIDAAKHMVLPAFALGVTGIAIIMRQTRSAVIEVLRQDYVTTARAKGLAERRVIMGHVLKNAMIPIVTILALQVSTLFGGSVLIERVFAIPGLGRLTVDAAINQDYPLLQALVLLVATAVVMANLAADLLYGLLDPRIRL